MIAMTCGVLGFCLGVVFGYRFRKAQKKLNDLSAALEMEVWGK